VKGRLAELCVEHSSNERRVSDDVGGADVRDRVLGRYAGRGAVKTACRGPSERLRVPLNATECL
jgi:hypothetical protein